MVQWSLKMAIPEKIEVNIGIFSRDFLNSVGFPISYLSEKVQYFVVKCSEPIK